MKEFFSNFSVLFESFTTFAEDGGWKVLVMWAIGIILIYLAIKKDMEPALLLPLGFGTLLVNIPLSSVIMSEAGENGALTTLYNAGIANELFPLLLFIGIGAMMDFGPLLSNPKLMLFGAAAQFGIFFTFCVASIFFPLNDAASIGIIGSADGPTSIAISNALKSQYQGAIIVAAYSYMALVPMIQPPIIKLCTTKSERMIRMPYKGAQVSKATKIAFPIIIVLISGLFAPSAVELIGFLMFGNLLRESLVVDNLSQCAQKELANIVTIILGITISFSMQAENFLRLDTLLILGLGLFAFVFDTFGGVMFAKFLNLFLKTKINPMIGAAGISAFPMSSRVIHKMGLKEDKNNFLLMYTSGINASGQIASVVAGGLMLSLLDRLG